MLNCKCADTLLPSGFKPMINTGAVNPELRTKYQSVIGSLLYLSLGTWPDIAYTVIKLAQYSSNPSVVHYKAALTIVHYIAWTPDYHLVFDGKANNGLCCWADSDWATDSDTRQSQMGYVFKLASSPVCWSSHTQKTVTLSSTEAEYMSLSDTARQIRWIQSLFGKMGFKITKTPLISNNMGSLFKASNPVVDKCTKHIDIKYHHILECVDTGIIDIFYIPTDDQVADILTKNLT